MVFRHGVACRHARRLVFGETRVARLLDENAINPEKKNTRFARFQLKLFRLLTMRINDLFFTYFNSQYFSTAIDNYTND